MSKKILAVVLFMVAIGLWAAPVVEKVPRSYNAASKNYDKAEYYSIHNDANAYLVYLQWMKVTPKCDGGVTIGLPEPVFWQQFVNRDFTTLTINGIRSSKLEPKSVTMFNEADRSGVELLFNFDGVKMIQRFYMQGESPLLIMEWSKAPDCEYPIEKAELSITTYPSYSVPNGGKKSDKYKRVIQTPANKYGPFADTKNVFFKKTDTSFIMYDEAFEPSNTEKAKGPCYMTWNWNGIKSAKCWFGQIYCMNFMLTLDPQATKWQFGLWEYKKAKDNQEFLDMYNSNKSLFELPNE